MRNSHILRKYLYVIIVFMMGLSGFAQMPIFKRYYIADIPGFGWLAEFYISLLVHYTAAAILIAFTTYILIDFLLKRSSLKGITVSGYFKITTLFGLMVTGAVMVYKNQAGVYLDHQLITSLYLIHTALCMVLIGASVYSIALKKKWVQWMA